jgi:hypothetical protein
MSVRYPAMLAGLCPGLLQVLPTATFLSTDWRPESLAALFDGQAEVPPEALALHLWESHAWDPHLSRLTPEWLRSSDSTFARLARPYLPEAPGRGLPAQTPMLDFRAQQQMDLVFAQVNRVDPHHAPAPHHRVQRRLKAIASGLRDAWHAPVQARLDQFQVSAGFHQVVPLPATAVQPSEPDWARCGSLDGSWELIQPHLLEPQCSALLLTGPLGEPSACAALARHPGSSCLWVAEDLHRAAQLAAWMEAGGIDGRAIHHPHCDPWLIPHLVAQQFTSVPVVLALGPTPHLETILQGLAASDFRPGLVLVTVNPAVERLQQGQGPAHLHPRIASQVQGPAASSAALPLKAMGYRELSRSGDGQFLLLQHELSSHRVQGEELGRLIPPLRLRSLYGDSIIL